MNETFVITLFVLAVVTFIVITVRWWFRPYKDDDYIKDTDYVIDDFYTFRKKKEA